MVRYSFLVGLFHPRLHAGLSRRLRRGRDGRYQPPPAQTRTCRNYCIRFLPWIDAVRRDVGRHGASPAYTTLPLGHAYFPDLCQARVEHHDVLLGHRPSLHHLRRRYLYRPCSVASLVLCRCSTPRWRSRPGYAFGFPCRSGGRLPRMPARSLGSRACSFSTCVRLLDYAGPASDSRYRPLQCCIPVRSTQSAPQIAFFEARFLARRCLCLHFTRHLAAPSARLEVKMVRYSFLVGLFHPRLHAGLSRRLRSLTRRSRNQTGA